MAFGIRLPHIEDKMKYTLIKNDGTVTTKRRMSLKEMQDFVGGYIEIVGNVICNEDGRFKKLPPNCTLPMFVGNIIIKEGSD